MYNSDAFSNCVLSVSLTQKASLFQFYLNQDGLCPEGRIPGASAKTGNPHYTQDAQDAAALGFDGLKFDAGGGNDNMTLWAEAVNATGREILLENCNNGGYVK